MRKSRNCPIMNLRTLSEMQNLDFSNRLQKSYLSEITSEVPDASPLKAKNTFSTKIILASVLFLTGVFTGFKISEITGIEKDIVKYPETSRVKSSRSPESQPSTFANPSAEADESGSPGQYLIKIGTFPPDTADSLTTRLNNDSKLVQIKPSSCRGIDENIPERYIAFRTPAGTSGQNVFLGCFQKKWQAVNALKIVRESSINGTGGAQLFEIE